MLQRLWQGRTEDIPEKYKGKKIPGGYSNVIIYLNGSRTYHHGFPEDSCQITEINKVMSHCWDSLSPDMRQKFHEREQKASVDKQQEK